MMVKSLAVWLGIVFSHQLTVLLLHLHFGIDSIIARTGPVLRGKVRNKVVPLSAALREPHATCLSSRAPHSHSGLSSFNINTHALYPFPCLAKIDRLDSLVFPSLLELPLLLMHIGRGL